MTTLADTIGKGKRMGTIVTSYKLLKNATVEYFENEKFDLTFCKGTDPTTGLIDSVLVRTAPDFTEAEFVSLINIKVSDKGERANQVVKITKTEFNALLADKDTDSNVI